MWRYYFRELRWYVNCKLKRHRTMQLMKSAMALENAVEAATLKLSIGSPWSERRLFDARLQSPSRFPNISFKENTFLGCNLLTKKMLASLTKKKLVHSFEKLTCIEALFSLIYLTAAFFTASLNQTGILPLLHPIHTWIWKSTKCIPLWIFMIVNSYRDN